MHCISLFTIVQLTVSKRKKYDKEGEREREMEGGREGEIRKGEI